MERDGKQSSPQSEQLTERIVVRGVGSQQILHLLVVAGIQEVDAGGELNHAESESQGAHNRSSVVALNHKEGAEEEGEVEGDDLDSALYGSLAADLGPELLHDLILGDALLSAQVLEDLVFLFKVGLEECVVSTPIEGRLNDVMSFGNLKELLSGV